MKTLLRTILTSLVVAGCVSAVRAADNDLFASINGGSGNGAGFVYQYTPAGAQSTFLSGQNRPRGLAFGVGGNIFMATNTSTPPSGVINGTIYQVAPDGTATSFATGFGDNVFLEGIASGFGGALAAPTVAVALGMDGDVLTNAFVVVVIGGLGSFAGSFVSALLVGLLQSFGILVFPAISIVLLFALMAIVLIVRPWGLLGRPEP